MHWNSKNFWPAFSTIIFRIFEFSLVLGVGPELASVKICSTMIINWKFIKDRRHNATRNMNLLYNLFCLDPPIAVFQPTQCGLWYSIKSWRKTANDERQIVHPADYPSSREGRKGSKRDATKMPPQKTSQLFFFIFFSFHFLALLHFCPFSSFAS